MRKENKKKLSHLLIILIGEPVVSKDQRVGQIKQSDIGVQIHTITGRENYRQVSNFRDSAI